MLKNFLLIAFRNLLRNKMASLIKLISLSTGMVCFAILSLFVHRELTFDTFHENPGQVYRVVKDFVDEDGSTIPDATTPPALGPALSLELPEIASSTRVFPNWGDKYLLQIGDSKIYEEKLIRIDSSFFDVFTFPFVRGDKESSLSDANFILLTENAAARYFSDQDPIGKIITISLGDRKIDLHVTGILKNVPETSHFTFEFLISVRTFNYAPLDTDWDWYNFYTYVRLKPDVVAPSFIAKLQPLFKRHNPESKIQYYAQPITDIHLRSKLKWELSANGDEAYVRILQVIALAVVLLAVINYVNLVTSEATKRSKEVGIRKASGALQGLLIRQFMLESIVLATLSTIISIAVAQALLPLFEPIFNSTLSFLDKPSLPVLGLVAGVGLLTGVLAGIYPAFYLASFKPAIVLKASYNRHPATSFLRKGLVTFQFVISTILIIGTLIISSQIDFMRSKNIGFNKENIVMIRNVGGIANRDALMEELRKINGVVHVGGADGVLGGQNWTNGIETESRENSLLLNFLCTDYYFLDVMGVSFKEGRNFSPGYGTDSAAVVVNEATVKQLGIPTPAIGTRVITGTNDAGVVQYSTIIGVIADFHFTSFHEPIKPFGFFLYQPRINTLFLKIDGTDLNATINAVAQKWSQLITDRPFEFSFQDEQVQKLYTNEKNFQRLFSYFTIVAIIIACLGLLGLSAFTAQQRIKEIGIRKVLGANVASITQLLSTEFLKLVVIAIVISVPLAWYLMHRWLESFAYHIEMSAGLFLIAAVTAILIAGLTVSFQSIKAATANPINSLRNE